MAGIARFRGKISDRSVPMNLFKDPHGFQSVNNLYWQVVSQK